MQKVKTKQPAYERSPSALCCLEKKCLFLNAYFEKQFKDRNAAFVNYNVQKSLSLNIGLYYRQNVSTGLWIFVIVLQPFQTGIKNI